MWKWIITVAIIGWAGIVGLAWRLADGRIDVCHKADTYTAEANCIVRTTAARDFILVSGLTVALAAMLLALIAVAIVKARRYRRVGAGWPPTSSARPALPR